MEQLRQHTVDVLLLDLSLPDVSGLDVLKHAKAHYESVGVLILSAFPEAQYGLNVLRGGASGFVGKGTEESELFRAIRTVARGGRYVGPELADLLVAGVRGDPNAPLHSILSEREFQIFCKLAQGESVSEIANRLFLSVKTVSTYRSRILEKMSMKSNADITTYALRNNLDPIVRPNVRPRTRRCPLLSNRLPEPRRTPNATARATRCAPTARRASRCASCWSRIRRCCAAGSRACCRQYAAFKVTGLASAEAEAVEKLDTVSYDAIVVDVELRPGSGIGVIRAGARPQPGQRRWRPRLDHRADQLRPAHGARALHGRPAPITFSTRCARSISSCRYCCRSRDESPDPIALIRARFRFHDCRRRPVMRCRTLGIERARSVSMPGAVVAHEHHVAVAFRLDHHLDVLGPAAREDVRQRLLRHAEQA